VRAEVGRFKDAVADLELAVSIYAQSTVSPTHLAHAQIALGMALWTTPDKARARALVMEGLAKLQSANATWAGTRREAETWLASHR